jgi:hypothetical protein
LEGLRHERLDQGIVGLLRFEPTASLKTVLAGVCRVVKDQQKRLDIPKTKPRPEALVRYLPVWDAREGWSVDHYDGKKERKLRDIARELAIPLATVQKQYHRAFQLLTGRDYSRDVWMDLFGVLKISKRANWRHGRKGGEPRNGRKESEPRKGRTITASQARGNVLNRPIGFEDHQAYRDLLVDIESFLEKGHTDEQIIRKLRESEDKHIDFDVKAASELIGYIRDRGIDGL